MRKAVSLWTLITLMIINLVYVALSNEKVAYAHSDKPLTINWLKTGETLYKRGKYKEAIDAADQAIKIKIDNAEAYYLRGKAYGKLKNNIEEKKNYEKAIILNPEKYFEKIMGLVKDEKRNVYYNNLYDIELKAITGWEYDVLAGQKTIKRRTKNLQQEKIVNEKEILKYWKDGLGLYSVVEENSISKLECLSVFLFPLYDEKGTKTERQVIDEICNDMDKKKYLEMSELRSDIKVRGKSAYLLQEKLVLLGGETYINWILIPSSTHVQGIVSMAFTKEEADRFLELVSGLEK